jgi:hypothetical protein
MLDEYALVPDIFDPSAYSNPAFIEMCLPHLKEPILREALIRDLSDGGWSKFCLQNTHNLHRLCREILKKLATGNRLRRFPPHAAVAPTSAADWCQEGIDVSSVELLTGIIAGHITKESFPADSVASIEKLTGTTWWQARSPTKTIQRNTTEYLRVLNRILLQANSLMFIDPNLDPSAYNYREFHKLLLPLVNRAIKPRVEIHRSFCAGDGPRRVFPSELEWKAKFGALEPTVKSVGINIEVFLWDDFHERYLIADIVGIMAPGGFDVTGNPNDWSTWGRLGRDDKDKIQRLFDPAARPDKLKWSFVMGNK